MKAILKLKNTVVLAEVPQPQTDDLNNVLIKVEMAALCRTDLNVAKGKIPSADNLILGHEFYGRIVEIPAKIKKFKIGDKVTVDPSKFGKNKNLMCGVDVDGAFAEYIKVPDCLIYKLPENLSAQYSAYVEPIAASSAVLNAKISKKQKGCIYGKNRIASLTLKILQLCGYSRVEIADEKYDLPNNEYDYVIETVTSTQHINKIIDAVKPGGIIVLKSRAYNPVEIVINNLVKKNLRMIAVNYGDFNKAIEMLASGKLNLNDLIGDVYNLEDFEKAFIKAENGEEKKIYLKF